LGDFNEHVLFGFILVLSLIVLFDGEISFEAHVILASILTVFIGSVLPDIDHKKAYVHRSVKSFTSIASGVLVLILLPVEVHYRFTAGITVFLATYLIISRKKMRHRGFTHSFSFLLIVSSLTLIPGKFLTGSSIPGIAMGLGILSHLLMDGEVKLS
jgi:membrane-bound metal-dependent hydrolase YbcI (DUF457 family)